MTVECIGVDFFQFVCLFCFGITPRALRGYSRLWALKSFLTGLGDHIVCQRLNLLGPWSATWKENTLLAVLLNWLVHTDPNNTLSQISLCEDLKKMWGVEYMIHNTFFPEKEWNWWVSSWSYGVVLEVGIMCDCVLELKVCVFTSVTQSI